MNTTVRRITSLEEGRKVWEALSPNGLISDDFSFRYAYYNLQNYPLYFYTAYEDDKVVGLLPLQLNTETNKLEFFGGTYFEDNRAFVKDNNVHSLYTLFSSIDHPADLLWMHDSMKIVEGAVFQDYKYILPLSNFKNVEDYMQQLWSKKSISNAKSQFRKFGSDDIKIVEGRKQDLARLIEFNKMRFGEESTFNKTERLHFFNEIFQKFETLFLSIFIKEELVGVGVGIMYNKTYIGVNMGVKGGIDGLGKFLTFQKIDQAIAHNAQFYDGRGENLGWKESFHFEKRPQYKFSRE